MGLNAIGLALDRHLPNSKFGFNSMSQGFNQANFSFSDGFQRSRPQEQHQATQIHVAQQSRRDKLRIQQGFEAEPVLAVEQEQAEIPPVYEGGMMLSEMFNFPATVDQIPANWRFNSNEWYGRQQNILNTHQQQHTQPEQQSLSSLGIAKANTSNDNNNFSQHQISDINADSAVAMQLFLMSPQTVTDPSSSSASTPLHFLDHPNQQIQAFPPNFPPACFSSGNNTIPAEFISQQWNSAKNKTWVSGESQQNHSNSSNSNNNKIGIGENQGLSLSLSSLQHLEAAIQGGGEVEKTEDLRIDNGVLLYSHGLSSSSYPLKNLGNSLQGSQQQINLVGKNFGNSLQNPQQFDLGFMKNPGNLIQSQQQIHHSSSLGVVSMLRSSRYLRVAQELLEEFCSVGRGQFKNSNRLGGKHDNLKWSSNPNPNPNPSSSSSSKDLPPLSPSDRFEHQRRKAKLLSMLDEVDRRYSHYCEQMQMVVNSFDYIMGVGAATPYTALAQKAMSRHFRCLRDAIGNQLKITSEMLGEKDGGGTSGVTKGETPRLRLLEQSLRQQRAFSQIGMMEQEAWRPQRGLPERSVNILRAWLFEHFLHPYPSDADKHLLARQTGLSRNQVSNWFINARVRLWKPMVEEMYQEENKDEQHQPKIQTTPTSPSKRAQLNASESDASHNTINKHSNLAGLASSHPFSENQAFNNSDTNSSESQDFPTTDSRKGDNDGDDDEDKAKVLASGDITATLAAAGNIPAGYNCVSLTLGLRHAGNLPENNQFSGNRGFKVPGMNQLLRDFTG